MKSNNIFLNTNIIHSNTIILKSSLIEEQTFISAGVIINLQVKLFIGLDPISLRPCFWLRIVFPLIATEFQEPNVEKQLFSSQNKDIRHKLVDICYCKKHLLGRSELEDLDIGRGHRVPQKR